MSRRLKMLLSVAMAAMSLAAVAATSAPREAVVDEG